MSNDGPEGRPSQRLLFDQFNFKEKARLLARLTKAPTEHWEQYPEEVLTHQLELVSGMRKKMARIKALKAEEAKKEKDT